MNNISSQSIPKLEILKKLFGDIKNSYERNLEDQALLH
jgi:hypothetical protein